MLEAHSKTVNPLFCFFIRGTDVKLEKEEQ